MTTGRFSRCGRSAAERWRRCCLLYTSQNGEELGFLREVILNHREGAERSLAAEILAECRRRKPAPRDDDMTCFTVQVHEAEKVSEREEIPSA